MSDAILIKLRSVLKTLDDDALASLANKGLLRRAQKDLATLRPAIAAVEPDRVRVQFADAIVEVPESPARSTCSCPATGICRHILGALVFLRDDPALVNPNITTQSPLFSEQMPDQVAFPTDDASAPVSPADVLGAASDQDLQQWAGKALFRKSLKAMAANPRVEIETDAALVVRFPARNITCRWIPSGGLLGMVCSCQSETVCEHVVSAVLAYQLFLGRREIVAESAIIKESAGAARSRAEVLTSLGTLLREIVALGLSRLSAPTIERLTTLAVSAHGVDLPRLERMLKSLADEIALILRRDAQSSSTKILSGIARCEALRTALLAKPTAAIVGQHRTQYLDVGQLTLVGLGAQHWRSKGGYHGITVFFLDESRGGFSTWSESRPVDQPGFNPVSRFGADGPWPGCSSPRQASGSEIRLSGAWCNATGRISSRSSTRALVLGSSRVSEISESIVEWSELHRRAEKLFSGRLGEQTENLDLALLAPATWGPAFYDSLRQELLRPVLDRDNRQVQLWLPFTPENESAIGLLERHDPAATRGLLGAIRFVDGQFRIQPISLFVDERVVNLNLEQAAAPLPPGVRRVAAPAVESEEVAGDLADGEATEDADRDSLAAAAATQLGQFLVAAQAEIEAIAESGVSVRHDLTSLRGLSKRMEALGLTTCSRALGPMIESLAQPAQLVNSDARRAAAARLLHAYYVLQLAASQETITLACAGLG